MVEKKRKKPALSSKKALLSGTHAKTMESIAFNVQLFELSDLSFDRQPLNNEDLSLQSHEYKIDAFYEAMQDERSILSFVIADVVTKVDNETLATLSARYVALLERVGRPVTDWQERIIRSYIKNTLWHRFEDAFQLLIGQTTLMVPRLPRFPENIYVGRFEEMQARLQKSKRATEKK